ncbi:39S ribosomal protein L48 mitochondrial [Echinococcus multilocularis]|uniref:39S ribosomal protein L48 mitochondrial n=1 Tax=Echinococcus multilocularis TaxID=6211 RepID=A0A087W2B8_ECHMU|nr:39S ribosomal protein L48 mitochondrial [Echinococcus multilocularis]
MESDRIATYHEFLVGIPSQAGTLVPEGHTSTLRHDRVDSAVIDSQVYLTSCVVMHSPKIFPRVLIARNRLTKRFKTYSYDPFYICRKPSIPLFPRLQFSLKGYDFPTLEKYEIYLNKTLRRWVSSVDSFPLPPKKTLYKVYHPNSTKVKTEFELNHYSRIVCAENVKTVDLPIIFDLVQQNLPEGIELAVEEFDPLLEKERYVANLEVETLQGELTKLTAK